MNTEVDQNHQSTLSPRNLFDQTLKKHIKRLIGTSNGIGGLPLDVVTLSCFIILTEHSKIVTDHLEASSGCFTQTSLIEELKEIGLPPTPDLGITIQEMVEKGYIGVDERGNMYGEKPTISMAQLLNHTFPKMPGMNLVAYLIQTLDEVNSGRKDPAVAIRQFDETLTMQGVQLKRKSSDEQSTRREQGVKSDSKNEESPLENNSRETFIENDSSLLEAFIHQETEEIVNARRTYSSESKIISSNDLLNQVQIKKVTFEESLPEQNLSENPSDEGSKAPESDKEPLAEETSIDEKNPVGMENDEYGWGTPPSSKEKIHLTGGPSESPFSTSETEFDDQIIPGGAEPLSTEGASLGAESFNKPIVDSKEILEANDTPIKSGMEGADFPLFDDEAILENTPEEVIDITSDDTIERYVIDFEEDLAMQCPLCKVKKVRIYKTLTGKPFYRCTNKNCHFISWGKPYHLTCPRCQNPFLIEIINRDNVPVLKCPRATCHYWQKRDEKESEEIAVPLSASTPQTPRRRFVKRRVVRKKR